VCLSDWRLLCAQHRRTMGRATSINLDDALPMEPAQLFPVAPAMPIKVPSGPPPPSNSSAESLRSRAVSGISAASTSAQVHMQGPPCEAS